MFKILTLVLMLTPSALAAQRYFLHGFIVTNSGDTVKGFVDYNTPRKMTLQCVFKVDERGQATIYSPGEISGYGFDNNKTFVVLNISEDSTKVEKAFVELLVQGDVSLYRLNKIFFIKKGHLYKLENESKVVEDQDVYYEQKRKEFIGVLNYLFIDCSGMSETIMKTEFKETDLVGIVKRYNECTGSGYKVFKEEKKSFELSYYVNAGIGFSTLKFRNDLYGLISQDVAEMKSKAPAFGVGLLVTDPLVVENLYASVEFQYSRAAFEGSYIKRTELYDYYENFSIRYSRLKFPLALSYNLSPNPSSLYLKLGLCFNFFFSGKLDARQRKEFNLGDEVIFYEDKSDMDGFRIIQFWAGLGYQLQINNKFKSYIEIRGEAIGGEGNSGVRTDQYALIIDPKSVKSNTWSVLVGVVF